MDSDTPASYVYLTGVPGSSVAKIGFAADAEKRLITIQTSSPDRLAVLWKTPGTQQLEDALHASFHALRKRGEWFDFGDADPVATVAAEAARLEVKPPNVRAAPAARGWANVTVTLDSALAFHLGAAADRRGVSISSYVGDLVRAGVARDAVRTLNASRRAREDLREASDEDWERRAT